MMKIDIGGLNMQYYSICHRKLWLYTHQIQFEEDHEKVVEGAILHEQSYARKRKEHHIAEGAKIDLIDAEFVQETKLSSKMQHSDELQLLYYLSLLRERGIEKRGRIAYTKEKKVVEIEWNDIQSARVEKAKIAIQDIVAADYPPPVEKKTLCKNCAYYDFCFALEEGE